MSLEFNSFDMTLRELLVFFYLLQREMTMRPINTLRVFNFSISFHFGSFYNLHRKIVKLYSR